MSSQRRSILPILPALAAIAIAVTGALVVAGDPPEREQVRTEQSSAIPATTAATLDSEIQLLQHRQANERAWYHGVIVAEMQRIAAERHAEEHRIADQAAAERAAAAPKPAVASKPAAPRTAALAPRAGACGGWGDTIAAHFPAEQVRKACSVMMCESNGNPSAENSRSSASGLWQFLSGTWESTTGTPAPASAYSAGTQTAAAATLWRSSGWSPWSCA